MIDETNNKRNLNPNNRPKSPSTAERLATCSVIAGITGMICSLFYFPASLISSTNSSTGLICGVVGILLAIMSRTVDMNGKKRLSARAVTGIVLSAIAIALTFFFFYLLSCYYQILSDPQMGPKFNEYINRIQQQLNQQMHLPGSTSWIH